MSKLEMTNAKLGPAHLPRAPEIRQNLQVSKHFCALAFGPLVVVWGTAASRARVLQGRARACAHGQTCWPAHPRPSAPAMRLPNWA